MLCACSGGYNGVLTLNCDKPPLRGAAIPKAPGFAGGWLLAVKNSHSALETMNRFEQNAKQRGLHIFARIDHAAGAAKIGKTLRPTEVLIFGNPQGGTPFMECVQTAGIDLPLKALAGLVQASIAK